MTNEQYIDKIMDKEAEMTSLKYQVEATWLSTQKKLELVDWLLSTLRMRCVRHSSDFDVSDYLSHELWHVNLVNVDAIDPWAEPSEDPFDKKLRGDEAHEKCSIQELFKSSSLSDLSIAEILNDICHDEYLKNWRLGQKCFKEGLYDDSKEFMAYQVIYYRASQTLDKCLSHAEILMKGSY